MDNLIILNEIQSLLSFHFGDVIEKVILFGSRCKGTASDDSDYDILVIVKNDYDWKYCNKIINACYDIDLKYDILTDIKIISHKELNSYRGRQPYIVDAINNGIST